jgi:hypothetical protein
MAIYSLAPTKICIFVIIIIIIIIWLPLVLCSQGRINYYYYLPYLTLSHKATHEISNVYLIVW